MEKVAIVFTASKYSMKILVDDYDKAQDVLSEARDRIGKVFDYLKEYQDSLAVENRVIDVNGSEILDINAGGIIISVTRDTLTQIKGTRLEALFSGRWNKLLPRDSDRRVFLDINPKCLRQWWITSMNERSRLQTVPQICYVWGSRTTQFFNRSC